MAWTRGWVGVAIASVVIAGTSRDAAGNEPPRVIVHVENYVSVQSADLMVAQTEVEDVFRAAGIVITWRQGGSPLRTGTAARETDGPPRLTLLLVNVQTAAGNPEGSSLGLAVRLRGHAFVFYNRVVAVGDRRPVDVAVLLGRVMAHELGHLMLPPGGHARYGLMRGDLDIDCTNPSRFTRDEAKRLRASLLSRSPAR